MDVVGGLGNLYVIRETENGKSELFSCGILTYKFILSTLGSNK